MIVGMDVGTSGIKLTKYHSNTKSLVEERVDYPRKIQGDFIEADMILSKVSETALKILEDPEVEGMALSTMAPVQVLLDERGDPLMAFHYSSTIGMKEWKYDLNEVRRETLNPPSAQMLPHRMKWLMEKRPEILEKARKVVDLNGYLFGKLSGMGVDELVEDEITAFEWGSFKWPSMKPRGEIVDLGIESLLPKLVKPNYFTEVKGKIFAIGTVDSVMAALGSVGLSRTSAFASMGSTLCLGMPSAEPSTSEVLYNDLYFDNSFLVNGCSSQFSDILSKMEELLGPISKVEWDLWPGLPILLPFFKGERSPVMDPNAMGILFGVRWDTTREDLLRAAMHSMVYLEAWMLDELGSRPNEVRVGGGAATLKLLRLASSVSGVSHVRLKYNPSSVGGIIVAANIIGEGDVLKEVSQLSKEERVVPEQSLDSHKFYLKLFKKIYQSNKDLFMEVST
jgi:xylulokinase